jgi:hypothetical protein
MGLDQSGLLPAALTLSTKLTPVRQLPSSPTVLKIVIAPGGTLDTANAKVDYGNISALPDINWLLRLGT